MAPTLLDQTYLRLLELGPRATHSWRLACRYENLSDALVKQFINGGHARRQGNRSLLVRSRNTDGAYFFTGYATS
jgi:hypothetical protein